jgi:hypothetical protein
LRRQALPGRELALVDDALEPEVRSAEVSVGAEVGAVEGILRRELRTTERLVFHC